MIRAESHLLSINALNWIELNNTQRRLPDKQYITTALEFVHYFAMKQNRITKDESFIQYLADNQLDSADKLLKNDEILTLRKYNRISLLFAEDIDISEAKKKRDELLARESVKKMLNDISQYIKYERLLIVNASNSTFTDMLKWLVNPHVRTDTCVNK